MFLGQKIDLICMSKVSMVLALLMSTKDQFINFLLHQSFRIQGSQLFDKNLNQTYYTHITVFI